MRNENRGLMIGDRGFGLVSILHALDPTVVHVHDAVAEIKDADVMSDHDDGPVGLNGDERVPTTALRRDAALLRGWGALLPKLRAVTPPPRTPTGST